MCAQDRLRQIGGRSASKQTENRPVGYANQVYRAATIREHARVAVSCEQGERMDVIRSTWRAIISAATSDGTRIEQRR